MEKELIYDMQYKLVEYCMNCIGKLKDKNGTKVEDMLKMGFNNSYIYINDNQYEIGFMELDKETMFDFDFEYSKIKDLKVVLDSYEINDNGYFEIYLCPLNEEEEKKFINGLF